MDIPDRDKILMSQAVLLHYGRRMPQNQVAKELGIGRSRISEVLRRARDLGYVTINPNLPSGLELGANLKHLFPKEIPDPFVHVVMVTGSPDLVRQAISTAGARRLESVLEDTQTIATDYGYTIGDLCEAHTPTRQRIKLYPIAHSFEHNSYGSAESVISGFYYKYGRTSGVEPHYLPDDEPGREKVLAKAAEADVLLLGASGTKSPMLQENLRQHHMDELAFTEIGAIGTCASTAFDRFGNIVKSDFDRMIPKVPGACIREAARTPGRHVILVAGGPGKSEAIRALIMGGWMNSLITDMTTAQEMQTISWPLH